MTPEQDKAWFAPKRVGYGAGLPIAWQGWAVLALYFIAIALALGLLSSTVARVVAILVATVVLIGVCKKKTAGGWRWRDGT